MPITEFQKQVRKYFKELEERIEHDNLELKLLRQLIRGGTVEYYPSTEKLQGMVIECLRENGGHAELPVIRDYLRKQGVTVDRPKLSVILTKCAAITFSRAKARWELVRKNSVDATKGESLPNVHH